MVLPLLLRAMLGAAAAPGQQSPPGSGPPLEFFGFRAGAGLAQVDSQLRRAGGSELRCKRSQGDPSVSECRASLFDAGGRPITLWLSSMDGLTGVLTLSGSVTAGQLTDWRSELEGAYGPAVIRTQGTQRMLQWIRANQMLRLTWREERDSTVASVSLVDGGVLDAWGGRGSRGRPEDRASTDSGGSSR